MQIRVVFYTVSCLRRALRRFLCALTVKRRTRVGANFQPLREHFKKVFLATHCWPASPSGMVQYRWKDGRWAGRPRDALVLCLYYLFIYLFIYLVSFLLRSRFARHPFVPLSRTGFWLENKQGENPKLAWMFPGAGVTGVPIFSVEVEVKVAQIWTILGSAGDVPL